MLGFLWSFLVCEEQLVHTGSNPNVLEGHSVVDIHYSFISPIASSCHLLQCDPLFDFPIFLLGLARDTANIPFRCHFFQVYIVVVERPPDVNSRSTKKKDWCCSQGNSQYCVKFHCHGPEVEMVAWGSGGWVC